MSETLRKSNLSENYKFYKWQNEIILKPEAKVKLKKNQKQKNVQIVMIQDEAVMLIIFIKTRFYTERNKTRQANFREKIC